jgi:hypothetical protein
VPARRVHQVDMRATLDILEEPTAETYRALLRFAAELGSHFSLVWRDQLRFGESALELERRLESACLHESRASEWPGTQLLGGLATIRTYRFSAVSREALSEVAGLYSWRAPALPEDLAFYTPDGRCWLGSTAHQRDAFVEPSVVDVRELVSRAPALKLGTAKAG